MVVGESALVIRHIITIDSGETFTIFQEPKGTSDIDEILQSIDLIKETKENPTLYIYDIHGECHRFFLECVSRHSMKMVKVTMKAADPNPFNRDYDNNELT